MKTKILLPLLALAFVQCTSAPKHIAAFDAAGDRKPSSAQAGSQFDNLLSELGLNSYYADLHAHHYMTANWGKKTAHPGDYAGPGVCDKNGSFPEDDGRPCRDDANGVNQYVMPENANADKREYFKMACDYGAAHGGLDILIISPHTKNNGTTTDTDTKQEGFAERNAMLADINQQYGGKFFCGLGQEASSISKGNHVGIYGHIRTTTKDVKPFFFDSGDFPNFYPHVKERRAAGEQIILQMNHPDLQGMHAFKDKNTGQDKITFDGDLIFGSLKLDPADPGSAKRFKDKLNDYGTDDYAPIACMLPTGAGKPVCEGVTPQDRIDSATLKQTFENMRKDGADSYRLIEVTETSGATENASESFRTVQHRAERSPIGLDEGLFSYIFYLNMGFKIAPTANQDNHFMNYGSAIASRTGVLAKSLTENEIYNALDQRRTYASEDKNAKLLFVARAGKDNVVMGGDAHITGNALPVVIAYKDGDEQTPVDVRIYSYNESDELDFKTRDNMWNPVRTIQFTDKGLQLPAGGVEPKDLIGGLKNDEAKRFDVPVKKGKSILFVEITQADKDKIWSAPIFVTAE